MVKVPEAGQWPDKLAIPALAAGAVLTTAGFLAAFLLVAPMNGAALESPELVGDVMVTHQQLFSQKIFYFHMPVAIVSFVLLAFGAYYGVRFLTTREARFDTCSRVAMELTLLFVVFTMITGDLWTRFEWGVWWTWDPRLTTYLILMLIVIAYFVMRNAVDDPELRATYASVVSVIAFVDVPICFMVTRLIPSSVHPVVTREGGMSPDMALAVMLVMAGMMLVAFGLYRLRFRQARLAERLQALKDQLDD
jgi:heme exporter protein C